MDGMIYASQEEAQAAEEKRKKEEDDARKKELVRVAHERFRQAEEAESEVRRLAEEDIRFRAGQQWNPKVVAERTIDSRPCFTINRMPQFERQITNEQRQSKPSIQVSPVDSGADVETAEVFQGLIRHIEYDSNADVAYDTALTSAVRGGFGYFRAITEYETEDSFEQCIKIRRVRDPFSVYLDPCAQEPDASDANWGFVVDDGVSSEQFKEAYPDAEAASGGWGSRTSAVDKTCQVVEYFYRERVEDTLLRLQPMAQPMAPNPLTGDPMPAGEPVPVGEPISALRSLIPEEELAMMQVLGSRPTHRIKVCWVKIAGSTVVEETEFPSKWIPIIPVLGDELWVDGKRILEGVIRNAKDPQRIYNHWTTAITETIAMAPKAPWIGYEGQFAGHEKKWAEASSRNVPYLQVRAMTVDGKPAPLPQRNSFDAPIGAMTQAMMFAADDMKATTGIYDAALGNRSNEQTGVAIRARQSQSQTSTMHFSDNLARALRHLGRILLDAIPRVYSSARVVRVIGEDQSEKMVGVNGHPGTDGQKRIYELGVGRYDANITMGPTYGSKRQEAVAASLELSRSSPQIAQAIPDLIVRNMDWPGAQEMADRLKKTLPPGLAEPDEKQKVDPTQLSMQLKQSQQMIEQLTQAVHAAHDKIESKAEDNASRERIAMLQAQTSLVETAAKLESSEGLAKMDHVIALISKQMDSMEQQIRPTPLVGPQGEVANG